MAKKAGRGAAIAQGISTGVETASKLGLGLPGALGGALLGGVGGAIFGGDEAAALRQEELEELKRRQEMGTLGLSDEQEAVLRGQIMGPASQLATERSNQMAGLAATQGLGAGTTASRALEETAKDQKLMQDAADKIAMMDMKQRIQEEARISELTGEVSAQQKADQNAVFAGILSTAGSFGDIRQEQQLEALSLEEIMEMRARQEAARGLGIETRGNTVEQGLGLYNSTFG